MDAEDSIQVLEPPKGQLEKGYSIPTPLNPCNLRSGSCMEITFQPSFVIILHRGGKIGRTRWASPIRPELGPGWAIKLLARKKPGQIWPGPVWPGPVWPDLTRTNFFSFKRLFDSTNPIFRAGWAVKILARKNQANFGPAWFWPNPLLARPSPPDYQL